MRVLAVGVTLWDLVAACGGTLARLARRGDDVTVTVLDPAGAADDAGPGGSAARCLGARLAAADGVDPELPDVRANRDALMDVIREAGAEVLLAPSPSSPSARERAAARLVFNAAYGACVPNYPSPRGLDAVPVRAPILYTDPTGPTPGSAPTYVDIGTAWDAKRVALDVLAAADGLPGGARAAADRGEVLSRARGVQAQVEFAEAFGAEPVWGRLRATRLLP
jgi:LmbE family N-acetylglucosaminyl deacetylase